MSNLVAIAYDDLGQAERVMGTVGKLVTEHSLSLGRRSHRRTPDNGKIKLHQPSLVGAAAASGALWGGLIGLIFLVPLFSMAVGAASGASSGRVQ